MEWLGETSLYLNINRVEIPVIVFVINGLDSSRILTEEVIWSCHYPYSIGNKQWTIRRIRHLGVRLEVNKEMTNNEEEE